MSPEPPAFTVGLTGAFGAGKSAVACEFERLGAKSVDADALAAEAFEPGHRVAGQIAENFPEALNAGSIDRKRLAEIVFADELRRKKLETVIHPYVFERLHAEAASAAGRILIAEIPLLFETGFHQHCRATVAVRADRPVMLERLKGRGFSAEEAEKRWAAQASQEEKTRRADFVIDNSGNFEATRKQIFNVWEKLNLMKGAF
jgi:dephospho-CoA kinase